MKNNIIFVTGFFGAPVMQKAQQLAKEKGYALISLDEEIEKADGRSARRICMMMGEHEYRNKEYEALKSITECALHEDQNCALHENAGGKIPQGGLVVCCGDGVLHDDMSRELIGAHELIVLGGDMTIDELWENAREIKDSCHAFMHFGSDGEKRAAFEKLYERQRVLFTPYIN